MFLLPTAIHQSLEPAGGAVGGLVMLGAAAGAGVWHFAARLLANRRVQKGLAEALRGEPFPSNADAFQSAFLQRVIDMQKDHQAARDREREMERQQWDRQWQKIERLTDKISDLADSISEQAGDIRSLTAEIKHQKEG